MVVWPEASDEVDDEVVAAEADDVVDEDEVDETSLACGEVYGCCCCCCSMAIVSTASTMVALVYANVMSCGYLEGVVRVVEALMEPAAHDSHADDDLKSLEKR